MRIHGIGVDLADARRVQRLLDLYGARFLAKAFHPAEARALAGLPAGGAGPFLASRWAAKEALHKALGTQRLLFPDIEVHRGSGGRGPPQLRLHGAAGAYQAAQGLALHLTLSHEQHMAVAFVVATTVQRAAAAQGEALGGGAGAPAPGADTKGTFQCT
jgi:holo-[acyl-carrier protein] synthase